MNWNVLQRLLPARKARRRALVPLLVVVLLTPIGLIPHAQTASGKLPTVKSRAVRPPPYSI